MTANTTRISDGFVPDVWQAWMAKDTMETTAMFTSGIMAPDANLSAALAGGGRTINAPFWKDMGDDEPGIATDDPAIVATPETLTSGKDIVRRQLRTHAISVADLTPVITGGDPMARMRQAFSRYWERHFRRTLVNSLRGIFQDNINNFSSDMIKDISLDTSAAVTSAELISAEAIMDAAQTMGDAKRVFSTLIVHSDVQTRLAKLDLIDFIRDSDGRIMFETYMGYRLITDDNVTKLTVANGDTTNRTKYWNYLMSDGCVRWAEIPVATPAEIRREPLQGNGMGVEILVNRRQFAMHVPGVKWTDTSCAGEFPSYADLRNVLNWSRVYPERKQIPVALLVTNG